MTPEGGCMFCDPENQYSCLICIPGYYMNDNFSCIKIPEAIKEESFGNIWMLPLILLLLYVIN